MKASDSCIEMIKNFESCVLKAYKCPAGVWTIGYGHTGGITEGQVISKEKAEEYLRQDLIRFEKHVMSYDNKYHWTQNQFDAMVSFAYNIGNIKGVTKNGTRTIEEISNAIPLYRKAGGRVLKGLVRRRAMEKELFDKK